MNHALRRVSLACLAMFLLLLANANYVQGFQAGKLADDPGNGRTFALQYQYQRGSIITANNQPIAESKHIGGVYSYQRYLPGRADLRAGDRLRHPVPQDGHRGRRRTGCWPAPTRGSPSATSSTWSPGSPARGRRCSSPSTPPPRRPPTRRSRPSGLPSGAVAIDPRTGAILALASYPSFNPNKLATLNGNALNKADQKYLNSPQQPLLNRAINETFPPGSTFKIVTSSTAFSTGKYSPDSRYYAPDQPQAARYHQPAHQLRQLCPATTAATRPATGRSR